MAEIKVEIPVKSKSFLPIIKIQSRPKNKNQLKQEEPFDRSTLDIEKEERKSSADPIKFYDAKKPYFEFSNYAMGYPIVVEGIVWPSTEHYYQARKFIYDGNSELDREYAELIRNQNTPNKARILANMDAGKQNFAWAKELRILIAKYKDRVRKRYDWDDIKLEVMKEALRLKFSEKHPSLTKLLLDSNETMIIEDSPRDWYWGIGKDGKGQNWLGKLLMERRQELLYLVRCFN
jgi:ribA/ribD-fused uncharacterized protein